MSKHWWMAAYWLFGVVVGTGYACRIDMKSVLVIVPAAAWLLFFLGTGMACPDPGRLGVGREAQTHSLRATDGADAASPRGYPVDRPDSPTAPSTR